MSPRPVNPLRDFPAQPIEQFVAIHAGRSLMANRVKVVGTVIYRQDDDTLYIEDKTEGLYVETKQPGNLLFRQRIRLKFLGVSRQGRITRPMLARCHFFFRKNRFQGRWPETGPDQLRRGLEGATTRLSVGAHRGNRAGSGRGQRAMNNFLVLQATNGFYFFMLTLRRKMAGGWILPICKNGSKVAVTGVLP